MSNEALLISGISYKVRKLIEIKNSLIDENKRIKQELEEARVLIEQLQNELENKRKKLVETSLASALTDRKGVEKSIEFIDRLVEEIDRGIDVLSD
jgi:soluble cytochrome b562